MPCKQVQAILQRSRGLWKWRCRCPYCGRVNIRIAGHYVDDPRKVLDVIKLVCGCGSVELAADQRTLKRLEKQFKV